MYGFREIDAGQLKAWLDEGKDIQLVDVRTPAEVSRGMIPGAIPLPLTVLPMKAADLSKEKPVVFYCMSGGRSAQAAAFLANQGYPEPVSLRGGITAWSRNGYPVAQG